VPGFFILKLFFLIKNPKTQVHYSLEEVNNGVVG